MSLLFFIVLWIMTEKGIDTPDIYLVVVAILYVGDCILVKGSSIAKQIRTIKEK